MTILNAHQLTLFQQAQTKGLKYADDFLEVGVTYSAKQLSPNPHCRAKIIRKDEKDNTKNGWCLVCQVGKCCCLISCGEKK